VRGITAISEDGRRQAVVGIKTEIKKHSGVMQVEKDPKKMLRCPIEDSLQF
jgi:hypothetical protein